MKVLSAFIVRLRGRCTYALPTGASCGRQAVQDRLCPTHRISVELLAWGAGASLANDRRRRP
ncbi:MAG: hypothetical protein ACYCSN_19805 [Acidobacteriaceae bacterium]